MTDMPPFTEFLLGPVIPYCLLVTGIILVLFAPELSQPHRLQRLTDAIYRKLSEWVER